VKIILLDHQNNYVERFSWFIENLSTLFESRITHHVSYIIILIVQ